MWTTDNRARYDRSRLRYRSDLTEQEWMLIAPHIPPAKPGGNKRRVNVREVVNGLMFILSTGCQWRAIPKDLPPRLYLHRIDFVRWKRLAPGPGGHPDQGLAVSPVAPPATTVGEPGISANVTHDRKVAWFQSHEQGRLP